MIHKSFKVYAITSAIDGSEEKDIHCFKEQKRCHAGPELLTQQIKLVSVPKDKYFVPDKDQIENAAPCEMVVDEDQEGSSHVGID